MDRLLIYFGRFAIILAGYAAAVLTASGAMHLLVLPQVGLEEALTIPLVIGILMWSVPLMALFIAYLAFFPSVVVIGLSEAISAQSWLYHALAGGAVGIALAVLFQHTVSDDVVAAGSQFQIIPPGQSIYDPVFLATLAGAGMFGGLAYWMVAGRSSGSWRAAGTVATSPAP